MPIFTPPLKTGTSGFIQRTNPALPAYVVNTANASLKLGVNPSFALGARDWGIFLSFDGSGFPARGIPVAITLGLDVTSAVIGSPALTYWENDIRLGQWIGAALTGPADWGGGTLIYSDIWAGATPSDGTFNMADGGGSPISLLSLPGDIDFSIKDFSTWTSGAAESSAQLAKNRFVCKIYYKIPSAHAIRTR